jgi:hypothetical protein
VNCSIAAEALTLVFVWRDLQPVCRGRGFCHARAGKWKASTSIFGSLRTICASIAVLCKRSIRAVCARNRRSGATLPNVQPASVRARDAETTAQIAANGSLLYSVDINKGGWSKYCHTAHMLANQGNFHEAVREARKILEGEAACVGLTTSASWLPRASSWLAFCEFAGSPDQFTAQPLTIKAAGTHSRRMLNLPLTIMPGYVLKAA